MTIDLADRVEDTADAPHSVILGVVEPVGIGACRLKLRPAIFHRTMPVIGGDETRHLYARDCFAGRYRGGLSDGRLPFRSGSGRSRYGGSGGGDDAGVSVVKLRH